MRLAESASVSTPPRSSSPRHSLAARLRKASLAGGDALLDAVSYVVRWMPYQIRYLPADALTVPFAAVWPRRRLVVRNFATMLHTAEDDPRAQRLARISIRNYGRMAVDFLVARTMSDAEILARTTPVGLEHFNDAMRDKRGVIFVLPHVGSWDVGAVFAQAFGCKITVVTENNWATQLVAGSRSQRGVTLAPRDHSLRVLFRALARNEAVVLLSDFVRAGVQTLEVPYFGRLAPFPVGPARLAQHTGAPILVIASVRLPDERYQVEVQAPLRPQDGVPAEEAIATLTGAIASGFEHIIQAYPEQWYPFSPIWQD